MTGPATGRPTVFSLCAIVCIYMLGIRCKSRSLPKGLKRSCQFVFFIIQSKVLRQTLSELFFNKNFKLFHLDIFVKISLSLKRQPANLHLVTPNSCLRVRSATLSSLPSWLDTSVALLSSSVLSIVCTHFSTSIILFWFRVPTDEVVCGASLTEKENYFVLFERKTTLVLTSLLPSSFPP